MAGSKMHFEQLPVEKVKMIATEFDGNVDRHYAVSTSVPAASCREETWRVLAERVQNERDPKRMIELVQELINTLDAQKPPSASR